MDPHFGPISEDPEGAPISTSTYDPMDRPLVIGNSDTSADANRERVTLTWDPAGRVATQIDPKGTKSTGLGEGEDHLTTFTYDKLDRVIKQTVNGVDATQQRITQFGYDLLTGDLTSVTPPRGVTWTYGYDAAHRGTAQTDPEGRTKTVTYDKNGNVDTVTGDLDRSGGRTTRTINTYDARDVLKEVKEKFTTTRDVITEYDYDDNGNRIALFPPRAHDSSGARIDSAATRYIYDKNNRLTRTALPYDSAESERQYVLRGYDPSGNLTSTSLPVTSDTAAGTGAVTKLTYFDPGWIRTSDDPINPQVQFDHTAQGWQAERVPETATGEANDDLIMRWAYYSDGQVKNRRDQGGQPARYTYDPNNNLDTAVDSAGLVDLGEKAVTITASYTGFDEVAKVRSRTGSTGDWAFSDYKYDANSNVTKRRENGTETDLGGQITAPRLYEMDYDDADWIIELRDLGPDEVINPCMGDQRVTYDFFDAGWERTRTLSRAPDSPGSCTADPTTWVKKQVTTWGYFDNGKLETLDVAKGNGTATEHHQVGYLQDGIYVNGNRTSDQFWRNRKDGDTTPTCANAANICTATYDYDARDKLTRHDRGNGSIDTYQLDQPTQLDGDTTVRAGNVTTEIKDDTTTTRRYKANQLQQATVSKPGFASSTTKFWYDDLGNLDCVTLTGGSQTDCSPSDNAAASTNLVADYSYDYLNRLSAFRAYTGGSRTDRGIYSHDALDRTTKEVEDHTGTANDRTTVFSYQGLTALVTQEDQSGGTGTNKLKSYSYDAYGHRLTLSDKTKSSGATENYAYGYDVHGSVSQLLGANDGDNSVKASYGYDAYGGQDTDLTTGDPKNQAPINPYRYTAKRMDSATATSEPDNQPQYNMGARQWGTSTGRFLQQDLYYNALANLGLATDPLTNNTYALAAGNPISYTEYDGHHSIPDGGGGGTPDPDDGSSNGMEEILTSAISADATHPVATSQPGGVEQIFANALKGTKYENDVRLAEKSPRQDRAAPSVAARARPLIKHKETIERAAGQFDIGKVLLAALLIQEATGRREFILSALGPLGLGDMYRLLEFAWFTGEEPWGGRSVGMGQFKERTALETMIRNFPAELTELDFDSSNVGLLLVSDDKFSIKLAAARLHDLKLDWGITDAQAFTAYAGSDLAVEQWLAGVHSANSEGLFARASTLPERMGQAGSLWGGG